MDGPMNPESDASLRRLAQALPYPPTPDLAGQVPARLARRAGPRRAIRLGWALAALVTLLAILLVVPSVRAAVLEFIQVGAIRIFMPAPTATPVSPTAAPPAALRPTSSPQSTPLPIPNATFDPAMLGTPVEPALDLGEISGATTLEQAHRQVSFPILLPDESAGLGPPDRVFVQDMGGPVLFLVWLAPDQPDQVSLSLHEFGPGTHADKMQPAAIEETTVNGRPAIWTTGPYLLVFKSAGLDARQLVEGHVLIWTENGITYRLESSLPLEDARRVAESLREKP